MAAPSYALPAGSAEPLDLISEHEECGGTLTEFQANVRHKTGNFVAPRAF